MDYETFKFKDLISTRPGPREDGSEKASAAKTAGAGASASSKPPALALPFCRLIATGQDMAMVQS